MASQQVTTQKQANRKNPRRRAATREHPPARAANTAPNVAATSKISEESDRIAVANLIPGDTFNDLYVLSNVQLRQGGKTGSFLTFRMSDATGTIPGVYWPAEVREAEEVMADIMDGGIARVKADVVSYRERTEVRVTSPMGGISPYAGDNIDPGLFVPCSSVSERELRDAVEVRIGLVADTHLRRLLRSFFADKERQEHYFRAPARLQGAHAYVRGLAEEAVEAARIAGAAAGSIPGIDRDLVTAAALLAPAGALLAYEETGLAHGETPAGVLMPVSVLAADLVERAAKEATGIPQRIVQRLRHILVREPEAHRFGWASGPDMLLPEAIVLHHALRISRTVPEAHAVIERTEQRLGVIAAGA